MLDLDYIEQLKSVFSKLENTIQLVYQDTQHADLNSLLELLNQVASTSSKIQVVVASQFIKQVSSDTQVEFLKNFKYKIPVNFFNQSITDLVPPRFIILKNNQPMGITFTGIPGGHEFTSFILAILNSDGKGKLPDELIQQRIKSIQGPIDLKTFISLTCENCPEVVQSLNQMATFHPEFHHEMIDGAYAQEEIDQLKIQGVPSVIVKDKLLHSGRSNFAELLTKVETHFGKGEVFHQNKTNLNLGDYDVAVVGGGPAGASAAIYSARKGLKTVLLAERLGGQVQDTKGIENLISVVYTEGPQLVAQLNQHLQSYPIKTFEHRKVKNIDKETKSILLESGEFLHAHSIIITTGAKWRELNIPGEKDYLGRGVAYCPHCDGPYYKGKKVAVIGGGNSGVEAAIDLSGIVSEVVLFEFNETLKADQVLIDKLKSLKNARIITSAQTKSVIGNGTTVTGLEYINRVTDETQIEHLDGIFVQIGLLPNSQFLKETVELNKFGEIIVDNKGRTSVPGIYAAGDVTTTPYKQIIIAMGEGAKAALTSFEDRMYQK